MGFIFVTLCLDILGIGLVAPILPKLIEQFTGGNVSSASSTLGWLVALFALMQFVFAPAIGSLSDRFGRRPVILVSLFGSGLDYLLLAFAPSLTWFYVGRIVAGITAANLTAATAYIADISPPEKRAQNFGMIGAAFGLGFIAGPALGGLLGKFNLRLPFLVAAGLTFLNWLYGFFVLPESLRPDHRHPFSLARANPVGSLAALRRFPIVLGLCATYFCLYLAQNGLHSTWVLYTGYRYNWNTSQTGASLAVVGVTAAIVQGWLVGKIVPFFGERRSIVFGLAAGSVSCLGYGLATQGWMIYAILVAGSIGGIAGPAAQGLISHQVPPNEQGAVQGALMSLNSLAGIIAPPMAANLFGYFISAGAPVKIPGIPAYLSAFLIFLALLFALRSFHKTRAASVSTLD